MLALGVEAARSAERWCLLQCAGTAAREHRVCTLRALQALWAPMRTTAVQAGRLMLAPAPLRRDPAKDWRCCGSKPGLVMQSSRRACAQYQPWQPAGAASLDRQRLACAMHTPAVPPPACGSASGTRRAVSAGPVQRAQRAGATLCWASPEGGSPRKRSCREVTRSWPCTTWRGVTSWQPIVSLTCAHARFQNEELRSGNGRLQNNTSWQPIVSSIRARARYERLVSRAVSCMADYPRLVDCCAGKTRSPSAAPFWGRLRPLWQLPRAN